MSSEFKKELANKIKDFKKQIGAIFGDTDVDNIIEEVKPMDDNNVNGVENKTGISSPWIQYVHKVQALFGKDPEIHISWDEERYILTMRVDNQKKADALSKLIPFKKSFGNVDIMINIVPANDLGTSVIQTIKYAFEGNPIVSKYYEVPDIMSNRIYYMMFAHEIVQYFDDNLADPRGYVSTLYEDIAADVIEDHRGVFFCTDDYINKDAGDK